MAKSAMKDKKVVKKTKKVAKPNSEIMAKPAMKNMKVMEEDAKEAAEAATKKAIAATKKKTKAKGTATKKVSAMKKPAGAMKKPAGSDDWKTWAMQQAEGDEDEDDGEEEEEEEEEDEGMLEKKNYKTPSKAQCKVFETALKRAPGTRGSLPQEVHDVWESIRSGPGTAAERHALRNAIVPKNAAYSHVIKLDPQGPQMIRLRSMFDIKQRRVQMKGCTESEVLWRDFHNNKEGMKDAIAKGDLKKMNGMYYWHRDIHERISGGKDNFNLGGGEPHALEDNDKILELLEWAPLVKWGTSKKSVPALELKMLPNQTAMP